MRDILKCYQILGVLPGTSPKAIKKTYRDLVKKWHPDRFPHDPQKRKEAEEKIKDINLAFERILDYRETLIALAAKRPSPPPSSPTPPPAATPPPRRKPSPKPQASAKPPPTSAYRPPSAQKAGGTTSRPSSLRTPLGVRLARRLGPAWVLGGAALLVAAAVAVSLFFGRKPGPPVSQAENQRLVPFQETEIDRETKSARPGADSDAAAIPSAPKAVRDSSANSTAAARSDDRTALPLSRESGTAAAAPLALSNLKVPSESVDSRPAERTKQAPQSFSDPSIASPRAPSQDDSSRPLISESLRAKLTAKVEAPRASSAKPEETADGQFKLGQRYAQGDGVPQDYAEAARLYRLAAQAGHADAQKNLGFLYAAGKGVPQDQVEAEKWFRQAGAKGNVGGNFASALLALTKTNSARESASRDPASALPSLSSGEIRSPLLKSLVRSSSLQTNANASMPAQEMEPKEPVGQYELGLRYANGEGVERDYARAAKWYRLAAEAGHAVAQRNLGLLYASGKGVPQDYAEAEKWLRKAAVQGVVGAALRKAPTPSTDSEVRTEPGEVSKQNQAKP